MQKRSVRNTEKILVVDDEMFNRILLEDILSSITEEFEVISASSGKAALDMIISEKPVLVFLDLKLPDITGWDVIERVRSETDISDTKIVLTTGCDLHGMKPGVAGHADAVLYKPFHPSKVLQVINNLSGRKFN